MQRLIDSIDIRVWFFFFRVNVKHRVYTIDVWKNGFKFHTNTMRWEFVTNCTCVPDRIWILDTASPSAERVTDFYCFTAGCWLPTYTKHKESWVFKSQYMSRYTTISFPNEISISNRNSHWFHFSSLVPFRNRYICILTHSKFLLCCFVRGVLFISFMSFCVNTDLLLNNEEFRGSAPQTKILIQLSCI